MFANIFNKYIYKNQQLIINIVRKFKINIKIIAILL